MKYQWHGLIGEVNLVIQYPLRQTILKLIGSELYSSLLNGFPFLFLFLSVSVSFFLCSPRFNPSLILFLSLCLYLSKLSCNLSICFLRFLIVEQYFVSSIYSVISFYALSFLCSLTSFTLFSLIFPSFFPVLSCLFSLLSIIILSCLWVWPCEFPLLISVLCFSYLTPLPLSTGFLCLVEKSISPPETRVSNSCSGTQPLAFN